MFRVRSVRFPNLSRAIAYATVVGNGVWDVYVTNESGAVCLEPDGEPLTEAEEAALALVLSD